MLRPFPGAAIRGLLGAAQKLAVIDRNFSFGASGIFAQELRSALCNMQDRPKVYSFIAGLGGRDVTIDTLKEIYRQTQNNDSPETASVWIGLRE
jgi:pyruvate/2-oxoacid:ferredoxin oxidoreductase alpha subunit